MKLFYSFREWKKYIFSAISNVFVGLLRIVWSILNGAVSLVAGVFRSVGAFTRREPRAMFVIGLIGLTGLIGWMISFENERAMRVSAEYQRDSLSLRLDSARQF